MHAKIMVLNPLTHPHTYPYALAYLLTPHLGLRPIAKAYAKTHVLLSISSGINISALAHRK